MNIDTLQEFLQWSLIINAGFYIITVVAVLSLHNFVIKIHTKLFHMNEEAINKAIYRYLATYKLLLIVFNVVPWIAIQLIK